MALVDNQIRLNLRLSQKTQAAVTRIWQGLPAYNRENVDQWLSTVLPVVQAAQRQTIALTDAYLARALDRPALGIDPEDIIPGVRNGTDPETVYTRPFVTLWSALSNQTPYVEAVAMGEARAVSSAAMDLQMAMRDGLKAVGEIDPEIRGYQRVANPDACEFCAALDGAQFQVEDPMPLHNFCACSAEPVVYTRGAKNRNNLDKFNDRSSSPNVLNQQGTLSQQQLVDIQRQASELQESIDSTPTSPPGLETVGEADSEMRAAIGSAAKELQDGFDLPEIPPVLRYQRQGDGSWGNYNVNTGVVEIDPSVDPDLAKMSYVHERGHMADLPPAVTRMTRKGIKTELSPAEAEAREALLEKLRETPTFQALKAAKKDIAKEFSDPRTRKRMNALLNYLMSDEELIARAFAQHVGTSRSGLARAWKKFSEGYRADTGYAMKHNIWDDEEFEPLRSALTAYLRVRGDR